MLLKSQNFIFLNEITTLNLFIKKSKHI